eukprot:TRINITY_DN9363_c0_g9_i1.p2 TRINITY_DN9363_c0_g9~~TRINITY_DN9363_c0_g9_i1.p2  ORF type:complete len:147 (+),score=46.39 TRINITY_DN9363_c0_g9_i1:320-760(+)
MYRDMQTAIAALEEEDIKGEEAVFDEFEYALWSSETTLCQATRIYEVVAGAAWGKCGRKASRWRRVVVSLLSLCKLSEEIIRLKLPMLEKKTKGVKFDIYGCFFFILGYPKRIRDYLAAEKTSSNIKDISEYRRMGEILAFEQYTA